MKDWIIRLALLASLVAGAVWFDRVRRERPERVAEATAKKILLLGNGTEVATLDPQIANGQPEHLVFTSIFEGLVTSAARNPDENAPGTASSWEHSPDFSRWTFHLRPEAKWSDGRPITARDFIWSYRRILNPDLAAEYASMLYPLRNAQEFNEGRITDFAEVGVHAPDDHTLDLNLTGPMPYLIGMLKHYSWMPVPRHAIERAGAVTDRASRWTRAGNMVCNGPFKLKEWRFTHSITVEKNPLYWDAANVKLQGIKFYPIVSDSTENRAFRDGQLHGTLTVPLAKIPEYRGSKDPCFHLEPQLSVYFYRINVTKPPLDNKLVRKALALAIDRESLIKNVLRAGQEPAAGLTPYPERLGYKDAPRVMRFDVAEAQRLLAEAGFPNGEGFPKFDILINTNEGHRIIGEAVQEMWRKHLNIPVGIHNQDWGVYLESQRRMDYSICRAAWSGDYPDPYTFLGMFRTGDGNNETGWSNARYDELLARSMTEPDAQRRFHILHDAEEILLDEVPVLPVYWYMHAFLLRPEVKNWWPSLLEYRCYKALDLAPLPRPPDH